jgi:hypothetical protein
MFHEKILTFIKSKRTALFAVLVVKIVLGKIFRFPVCLIRVKAFAITVILKFRIVLGLLWSSIFVTLMANKIGGLQFGIYRNCQISSRVFHTAVAALPLTKANRSDFE